MNPFVFACITPHGSEIIPELQGAFPERMAKTREKMMKLGEWMSSARPDSIIVLTPHGTRINGRFSISDSERMEGFLRENEADFSMEKKVDRELARMINKQAAALTACRLRQSIMGRLLARLPAFRSIGE
ncbi:hypothetical protein V1499_19395 [Neobacillus sp. SCS-31]|uniref:DODA-type extradiol aromatic ring-opening family dioxygenase n=1 Tax=Neobacillus oceani TaxID=3115292 RepID=UPI003905BBF0